jgi:hypothetical protein
MSQTTESRFTAVELIVSFAGTNWQFQSNPGHS